MLRQLHNEIRGCCLAVGAAAPHCCRKFPNLYFEEFWLFSLSLSSESDVYIIFPQVLHSTTSLFFRSSGHPFICNFRSSGLTFLRSLFPRSPFLISSVPPWSLYSKISKRKHWYSKLISARENECNHRVIQYNCNGKKQYGTVYEKCYSIKSVLIERS
jgi:hypothetical protein